MEPINQTLHSYLRQYALRAPKRKLLGDETRWLTVHEVQGIVESTACRLLELGVGSGDLIALQCCRNVETVLLILALEAIGAVAVLTDPHKSIQAFLKDCTVTIPVKAEISMAQSKHTFLVSDTSSGTESIVNPFQLPIKALPLQNIDSSSPGFIIFTSGSTGKSKAVVLSQYNLINNCIDAAPLGYYLEADIALGALPIDHVFGLVLLTGTLVLDYSMYMPEKTDIPTILNAIEKEQITRMNGVPSLYLAMAAQKEGHDLSSLRAGFIGGGPCTPEQFCYIEKELEMTLVPAYGMSECVGITSASYLDSQEMRAHSVGKFYARNTGKILLEDSTEAPIGIEGEICVDSHTRMIGYYGDSSPRSPLLSTGDLGYVDERGYVHISGRKKDIIIRNGVNLSPRKIEEALLSIPCIEDAAVIGLPDEKCGELPYAMVVCREGNPESIKKDLHALLAKNELPTEFFFVDTLPRTTSGKTDKQRIREVLARWKKV